MMQVVTTDIRDRQMINLLQWDTVHMIEFDLIRCLKKKRNIFDGRKIRVGVCFEIFVEKKLSCNNWRLVAYSRSIEMYYVCIIFDDKCRACRLHVDVVDFSCRGLYVKAFLVHCVQQMHAGKTPDNYDDGTGCLYSVAFMEELQKCYEQRQDTKK